MAIRFSWRQLRYQMDHTDPLMLLLKQTSTHPPGSSVCDIISASELHIHRYRTVKFDSEMAVARLIVY